MQILIVKMKIIFDFPTNTSEYLQAFRPISSTCKFRDHYKTSIAHHYDIGIFVACSFLLGVLLLADELLV